nr:uncharacterized protein LOC129453083 [Misgurnus anguillicaudatus]
MLDQPEGEGIFNRLFNAAARARQELAARNDDSTLLSTTRRLFRRRVHRVRGGSGGRRENPIWQTRLFLLPGPDNGFLPPTIELEELAKHGLGKPVHESTEAGRTNSKIGLNWSLAELNNFVCQSYPRISLNLVGFELARTGKGRKIQKLQVSSVKELKAVVGKSRLYIVPRATVLQVTSPPSAMSQNSLAAPAVDQTSQVVSDQVASTSSAVSMNSFPPLSIAPVQDETVAESTQAQSVVANQALQEWRAIRAQQDQEYNRSLLVDQEKERKKLAYQACEERRQKAIQARRQRMSACEEPSEGVLIKFKYPNGHINMRKFILSEPIQILFDFVGQDDIASEIFVVQEAASSRSVKSSSSGSIMNHGIKASTTLYVLWFSNMDVQNILSDQQNDGAYALHHTSHGQSSLPEPSTQPSLPEPSTRSLLPEPSTRSLLPEPSTRSLLPEPSTRSLLPEPSTRSLLPEPSTRSLLPEPSTRSLLPEPSTRSLLPEPSTRSLLPEPSTRSLLPEPSTRSLLPEPSTRSLLPEPSTRSLLPEPSTQPSLSVRSFQPPLPEPSTRSLLPEPSTQPSLSVLSFQPPLPEPSTQPPLPEPSNQPSLSLLSFQPPLPEPSTRSLLPEPSTQPSLSVLSFQPPLPEPSTRSLLPEPSTRSLLPEPSTQPSLSLHSFQPPLPEPSTRSLLPEPSTQPSLSVRSFQPPLPEPSTRSLPEPSNQPSLSLLSFQPPLPEPSTRSLLPEPSNQPSLSLLSFQPPLPEPSTHLLLPEPSNQPPLTLFSQPEEILTLYDEPALSPSAQEPIILDEQEMVSGIDLQTILKKMVSKVNRSFCPTSNQINVCRDNVLLCSLRAFKRKFFNPEAKLDVVFVDEDDNGEGAVDEGGPTREYLRLLMRAVHQSIIFEGHEKDRQLSLDTRALQTKLYMWVAKMIAVCVVHGGIGPHFFSERLFHQICGIPTHPATVDEVGDHTFREQLIKIKETTTVQEANSAIAEAADSLSIIGALRHVSSLKEKDSLVQSAADFFVNGRLATALDQFVEGLKTLGLLEELRKNPVVFYNMFVSEEIPLQAKDLCTLFEVDFSVQGSNRRDRENMTICFWRDWLIDIEEGECSPVTLEKVLEFTSGASTVPVLGFPHRPQIQFLHEANRIFPEANTCILVLRLPLHSSYEAFKQYMMEGILQAPTFGLA